MTSHGHRKRVRSVAAASTVALLSFATACTTLPGDSTPHVLHQYQPPAAKIEIPEPKTNVAPDVILRDFYSATAHPSNNYAAARKFLTEDLGQTWEPKGPAKIVDSINLISRGAQDSSRQTFAIRTNVVGTLGDDGAYESRIEEYEDTVEMRQSPDGQWRISQVPNSLIVDRQTFLGNHAPRNVYFLDPSGNQLVTDRRWIYRGVTDGATALLEKLKDGPSQPLFPGVTTVLPHTANIRLDDARTSETGGRVINVDGLGDVDQSLRTMLAAQIVWTLAMADIRGPWTINADGAPLVAGHEGPWTRDSDELRTYDPTRVPADRVRMRTVDANGLYEVADGRATPMKNGWGSVGNAVLTSAGVGVDASGSEIIAAVARSSREADNSSALLLGLASGEPTPVLTGSSFSRPSWSPDAAAVWTVKDGNSVVRIVHSTVTSRPAAEEVDISELKHLLDDGGAGISELRIDSSGTQAAMIINGQVVVATIQRSESAPWKLVRPRALPTADSVNPVTLTWSANHSITVGAYGTDAPMWRVYPDGATNSVLPKLNLSPPVTVVTATSSKLYALDTNALMELISSEGEEQFWRLVPGVGTRMAPVSVE